MAMYSCSRSLMVLSTILVLGLVMTSVVHVADETEEDFKKMKIKALRLWLDDRGLSCPECQEKADFIQFALKHADAKPTVAKQKVALPEGKFWEAWANVAKEMCDAGAQKRSAESAGASICPALQTAVDSVFMQHGKRTAQKLKKKPDALLKTSWGDVYQQAGRRLITKVIAYCFAQPNQAECSSSTKLQTLLETPNKIKGVDFIMYLTNVGIENTNPMYEIMKEKLPAKDEL